MRHAFVLMVFFVPVCASAQTSYPTSGLVPGAQVVDSFSGDVYQLSSQSYDISSLPPSSSGLLISPISSLQSVVGLPITFNQSYSSYFCVAAVGGWYLDNYPYRDDMYCITAWSNTKLYYPRIRLFSATCISGSCLDDDDGGEEPGGGGNGGGSGIGDGGVENGGGEPGGNGGGGQPDNGGSEPGGDDGEEPGDDDEEPDGGNDYSRPTVSVPGVNADDYPELYLQDTEGNFADMDTYWKSGFYSLFERYIDKFRKISLFDSLSFGSPGSALGSPYLLIDLGEFGGEMDFDFSNWDESLSVVGSLMTIVTAIIAIRIVLLKE